MREKDVIDQATRPSGFLGRMMGEIMAATNRPRNQWLLTMLDIQPRQRGLEFGFGNGETLTGFLGNSPDGTAVGIDWSASMIEAAQLRNADALAKGRLTLTQGDIANISTPIDGTFDRLWSSNVIQMIADRPALFSRLRALLAPNGLLAICFQPRGPTAPPPETLGPQCVEELTAIGFGAVALHWMPNAKPPAFCIVARP
jgi:SAM-dependent methyltransferase